MIDNPFRQQLAKFSKAICIVYSALGLSPNGVTVLGFLVGTLSAISVGMGWNILAVCLWWISRFFDGTDGIYARQTQRVSAFGAYLDIVLDMAAYSLMVLGFAYSHPEFGVYWNVLLFFYVLCIASALALGSLERDTNVVSRDNRGLRLAAGLAEGGETGIFYTVILLFSGSMNIALPIWATILFITVASRSVVAARELRK